MKMGLKKRLLLSAAALLAFVCCACGGGEESGTPAPAYELYYSVEEYRPGSSLGVFSTEQTGIADGDPVNSLLEAYFAGPSEEGSRMPLPDGTAVESFRLSRGTLELTLSDSYSQLDGIDKTIADYCLTLTMTQLPEVEGVSIRALSSGEQSAVVMRAEDLVLNEGGGGADTMQVTLYFADESGRWLLADRRQIVGGEDEQPERYIVEQLIRGPQQDGMYAVIPEGTELLSVGIEDGVCSVNLSPEFMENKPESESAERLTLYSITNSLTELEGVDSVRILIDGQQPEIYRYIMLDEPLRHYEGIIGPVGAAEEDVSLYVKSWSEDYLALVPTRVRRDSAAPVEELVMRALLSFEDGNGYYSAIPGGTELLSVSVSGDVCRVDLSEEFIDRNRGGLSAQRLSVNSIVASICAAGNVSSVQILVEGEAVDHRDFKMSGPVSRSDDMFYP